MKKYNRIAGHLTVENVKDIIRLWNTHSASAIAEKIGRTKSSLYVIASIIRKNGYKLERKRGVSSAPRRVDVIRLAIKELKNEQ